MTFTFTMRDLFSHYHKSPIYQHKKETDLSTLVAAAEHLIEGLEWDLKMSQQSIDITLKISV